MLIEDNTKLPPNIIEMVLNAGSVGENRWKRDKIVIHVSDLMKASTQDEFCPREFVLHYCDNRMQRIRSLPPGRQLLFETGHAIHEFVRNKWILKSPYGKYAWGVWSCKCKAKKITGIYPKYPRICQSCGTRTINYDEYSVFNERYRLVGHPDFIIYYNGIFYIYEIKTIDRQDVDFDSMSHALGDHKLQGSLYYWLLRWEGKRVSPYVRYLYVDRNLSKIFRGNVYKEFKEKVDAKTRIQPLLNKADAIITSIEKTRVLPPRICDSEVCVRSKNCSAAISCFNLRKNKIV